LFRFALKAEREGADLTDSGRLFHEFMVDGTKDREKGCDLH